MISEKLKLYIESANKLTNKSANKSADSDIKSANRTSKLTGHQKEILTIMEDGVEYAMEAIAGAIGLKGPRTRQTVIKIELRSKNNTIKSKEGFKEVRKHVHSIG